LIVLDASVLTDFLLGYAPAVEAVENLGEFASQPFHAPALIEPETLNALRGMTRSGQVSEERAHAAVAALGRTRRALYPHGPFRERVWELRHDLTVYDATYLALAERIEGSVLLTADRGLAACARRSVGLDRVQTV
jgi:predicted nucleic acid-binding protein